MGTPCFKRMLGQPCRTAFIVMNETHKDAQNTEDRIALSTLWPRSIENPNWGMRTLREGAERWLVTGEIKEGCIMEIKVQKNFQYEGTSYDGKKLLRKIKTQAEERWRHFPYPLRWMVQEAKLHSPLPSRPKGKGKGRGKGSREKRRAMTWKPRICRDG